MDIRTLLDNLNEELSCKVCAEIYTQPKQLPCLHSFCLACLNRLAATRAVDGLIHCPLCARDVRVPESGTFENFPSSFYINSLLDVLAIKQCSATRITCGNCGKKSEQSSYCFDCSEFWCGKCLNAHNILRANKDHRVTSLKDFKEQDYEDVFKRPAMCKKEEHKKFLEYYCKKCEVAACQVCITVKHGGHAVEHLVVVAKEEKAKILSQVQKAKTRIEQLGENIETAKTDCLHVQENIEAVKLDVNGFAEEIIRVIREQQRRLITEADNAVMAAQERLASNKEKIQNQVMKIESAVNQAENLLRRGASAEIVQSRKQVEENLQELAAQEPEIQTGELSKVLFAKHSFLEKSLATNGIGRLGATHTDRAQTTAEGNGLREGVTGLEAKFVVTTKNSKGDVCYSPSDRVAVGIQRRRDKQSLKNVQIQDNKNGTYEVRYFAADPGQHEVRVTVNGGDIRGSPLPPIQVKAREFRRVLSFGSRGTGPGQFNGPWGVAVNGKGEIAVSDFLNHRVQIFNNEGKFLFSFGGKGTDEGQFAYPLGVTYDGDGNLLVVDAGNNRIQQFSGTGQFIGTFCSKGELDGQLSDPCGISTCPDGKIIVANRDNKRVVLFSPEGRVLLTLHDDHLDPVHCIYHENRFLVSDANGKCIKVFSGEGEFLYRFGNEEGGGELCEPRCLAIDKSGRLVVCDMDDNHIKLFDLDGTFRFGINVNKPVGVAILSDGKFAISDCGGDKVVVME